MANTTYRSFAMMGYHPLQQRKLFVTGFHLEKRIREDHILRKVAQKIDFDFAYEQVKDKYGVNGNVSVPPPIILKMMLLLVLYNVRSERELMLTIPERLDWLWFLGYDLEDEIPNHSVLSKARGRWGVAVFKAFFERMVWGCVEAGLVDGNKLFVDSSLIDADASNNSVVDRQSLKRHLNKSYRRLEERLDDLEVEKTTPANSRYISTTDPDASVTRHSGDRSKLRYKTHRGVDPKSEVITATRITPGSRDDGDLLKEMINTHEQNTQKNIDTVVADTKYGKIDNFLLCHDLGIKAHLPSIEETNRGSGSRKDIFPKEAFVYNPDNDTFTCPAGEVLRKRMYHKKRKHYEYKASSGVCAQCRLREKCTRSKDGRTVKRHLRQNELDTMLTMSKSREAKRDIRYRQHLSERSFARSTRYGYKRARWRGLWRMEIQDFLISAIENITILINHTNDKMSKSNVQRIQLIPSKRVKGKSHLFGVKVIRFVSIYLNILVRSRYFAPASLRLV
jgi:transposase